MYKENSDVHEKVRCPYMENIDSFIHIFPTIIVNKREIRSLKWTNIQKNMIMVHYLDRTETQFKFK